MKRLATIVAILGVAIAGLVAGQALANGGTAPVYRDSGHDCATGATDPYDQVGHFTADEQGSTIYGTVQLEHVAVNASFPITLIQNHPCTSTFVGYLRTDSHGDGTFNFTARVTTNASEAFVLTSHDNRPFASGLVPISP
jgi:hypothetical protein